MSPSQALFKMHHLIREMDDVKEKEIKRHSRKISKLQDVTYRISAHIANNLLIGISVEEHLREFQVAQNVLHEAEDAMNACIDTALFQYLNNKNMEQLLQLM